MIMNISMSTKHYKYQEQYEQQALASEKQVSAANMTQLCFRSSLLTISRTMALRNCHGTYINVAQAW